MNALRIEQLVTILEERLGLACVSWQRERLIDLLSQRDVAGLPLGDPHSEQLALAHADLQAILDQVSVGETYFFRESAHFTALLEQVLVERLQEVRDTRPLRILSAGCSSGEEVYSIAITLREHEAALGFPNVELIGIDAHAVAIEKARRARYSAWALRMTPEPIRRRYFEQKGDDFQLQAATRKLVDFEERNLLELDPGFFRPGRFDVIFCRNVLIYFSDQSARNAVARMSEALAPGGYLFLGHSESLRGLSEDFVQCHSHDSFFYRKKPGKTTSLALPAAPNPTRSTAEPVSAEPWFEVIKNSAQRVAQLTSEQRPKSVSPIPAPSKSAQTPDGAWSALWPILEAIASEQFDAALQRLEQLTPPPGANDYAATLARATIDCGKGRISESQRGCQRLLDSLHYVAEAHYLLALCHEHLGDAERARRLYQESVRIAPRFAMAQLRLGALLRRLGQRERARVALSQAEEFISHAPREHVLLFGGGFQRAALLALCRAELAALGAET